MPKSVELRRHTANEGDELTGEGVRAAVEIGAALEGGYNVVLSSGAQRATQAAACFLAGLGRAVPGGVIVNDLFRSEIEDRWRAAYEKAGAGDIASYERADRTLVEQEAKRFGAALSDLFASLPEGGRALVVGHSPMHEVAVYGLTGEAIAPLGKGAGVIVEQDSSRYTVTPLDR